jgi:hypothetical protein
MEYARNPTALQELMRNHDRALSNLEVNSASYESFFFKFDLTRVFQVDLMLYNVFIMMCKNPCIQQHKNNLAIIHLHNYLREMEVIKILFFFFLIIFFV